MTKLSTALQDEIKSVEQTRDQLVLQAHFFKAELKTRWQELEVEWDDLREHLGRAKVAADRTMSQIDAEATRLIGSLKTGYSSIRDALKH